MVETSAGEYVVSVAGVNSALQRAARDRVKREAIERRRNVLYLTVAYLRENGLGTSADALVEEARLTAEYEVCDNVDLDTVLQEYQSYYSIKFGKPAKILRRRENSEASLTGSGKGASEKYPGNKKRSRNTVPAASSAVEPQQVKPRPEESSASGAGGFQIEVRKLGLQQQQNRQQGGDGMSGVEATTDDNDIKRWMLDSDFGGGYSNDWRELAEVVAKEIVASDLGVSWQDCVGLERAIECLKESVVYPHLYPELFTGLARPWRGVLLYGPPGTGKTLLSRAVASEAGTTFFNVSSSVFVNKWRGESEKMLKMLFELARRYAPSTVFVDELDSLACRGSEGTHDASRRFKSELLVQLDGITRDDDDGDGVFVLATTNRPWDLDGAVLRRFEKRILVDLPDEKARADIFRHFLRNVTDDLADRDFVEMASASAHFSGSDVKLACKEACMRKLREGITRVVERNACFKSAPPQVPEKRDIMESVKAIRPVTSAEVQQKYVRWQAEFGCL